MRTENLKALVVHNVGNKSIETSLQIAKSDIELADDLKEVLTAYFLNPFKSEESYCFSHDVNLSMNEVYTYASAIFENPEVLYDQSINLAKHLFNQSTHPKIKSGEFYVAYFENYLLNGEKLNVIGLFKSENKDTFLEIEQYDDGFEMSSREGVNVNKLDKGCLIFNTDKDNGFVVAIVDNTNRGGEAQYWKDDFLNLVPIKNEYHQTNAFLGIAKNFVTKQLSEDFNVSKADKIDLLNRSVDYFKSHDSFDKQEFEEEVFADGEVIDSFRKFDESYRQENKVEGLDSFEISAQAVKKQSRVFKSVLKLDKNFHIYIHGNRKLIEQGVDDEGRKFYKIYYQEES